MNCFGKVCRLESNSFFKKYYLMEARRISGLIELLFKHPFQSSTSKNTTSLLLLHKYIHANQFFFMRCYFQNWYF